MRVCKWRPAIRPAATGGPCMEPRQGRQPVGSRGTTTAPPALVLTAASRSLWLYCSTSTMGPTGSSGPPGPRSLGAGPSACGRRRPAGPRAPPPPPAPTSTPSAPPTARSRPSDLRTENPGPSSTVRLFRAQRAEALTGRAGASRKSRSSSAASGALPEEGASMPHALQPGGTCRAGVSLGPPRPEHRFWGPVGLSACPAAGLRQGTSVAPRVQERQGRRPGHSDSDPSHGPVLLQRLVPIPSHLPAPRGGRRHTCLAWGPWAPVAEGCPVGAGRT